MEVNCFQIFLIDVILICIFNMFKIWYLRADKNENPNICGTGG